MKENNTTEISNVSLLDRLAEEKRELSICFKMEADKASQKGKTSLKKALLVFQFFLEMQADSALFLRDQILEARRGKPRSWAPDYQKKRFGAAGEISLLLGEILAR